MALPPRRRWDAQQYTARMPARPPRSRTGTSLSLPLQRRWGSQLQGSLGRVPSSDRRGFGRAQSGRRNPLSTLALLVMLLIIFALIGLVGYGLSRFIRFGERVYVAPPPAVRSEPIPDIAKQPFNILLVGIDYRSTAAGEGARSDTLIVVRVDPVKQWATMISIPRDTYAYIPHKDTTEKINAAYSYGYLHAEEIYGKGTPPDAGGVYLAREAVEQFLDLKGHKTRIHYQVQIDFEGFKRMVDEIGGITVDVQKPLLDPEYPSDDGDHGYIRLYIPSGLQHMDGTTALRYARSRHEANGSDFTRSERQQQVIRSIIESMNNRGLIDKIVAGDQLLGVVEESLRTDLPVKDPLSVKALASLAKSLSGERIQSLSMDKSVQYEVIQRPWMIFWNEEDLRLLVEQWLRGPNGEDVIPEQLEDPTFDGSAKIQVLNGTNVAGLAKAVTQRLSESGFETLTPADADADYKRTQIIDYSGRPEASRQLAELLGLDESAISTRSKSSGSTENLNHADIVLILGADYHEEWRLKR